MKRMITAVLCTGAVVFTMGAAEGCGETGSKPGRVPTSNVQTLSGDSLGYNVTESRRGVWGAPQSAKNCKWTITYKDGRKVTGGKGRGGSNSVILNRDHKKFATSNCVKWTKRGK